MGHARALKFVLNEKLAADSREVGDLQLCRVLLMNDARFPWLVLVPRYEGVRELFELPPRERNLLVEEVAHCAKRLLDVTGLAKINIGMLGNVVPQMHVHVVARSSADSAWPGPVWGFGRARAYAPAKRATFLRRIRKAIRKA